MDNNELKRIVNKLGTPIYVYDIETIRNKCEVLKKNFSGVDISYACKANTNLEIIKLIHKEGFCIETVSPGEIEAAHKAGVKNKDITFTCGSITEKELCEVVEQGIRVHLDSIHQVETTGKNFPNTEISVRLNLNVGAGHHSHVITGGPNSKFGIEIGQLKELKKIAQKNNLKITGLHQHIGSNILDVDTFIHAGEVLTKTALSFPDLEHLDFGGGFGIPYGPDDRKLNIEKLGKEFKKLVDTFTKKYGRKIKTSIEPGRYLVAEAGYLLMEVNDKKINQKKTFVGVNSGLNHLIRPAMYGAYHEIINLNNTNGNKEKVTIAGNMCESGDVFAKDRNINFIKIGDKLAIKNAGAYGYVMSSNYNLRPKAKEFIISGKKSI